MNLFYVLAIEYLYLHFCELTRIEIFLPSSYNEIYLQPNNRYIHISNIGMHFPALLFGNKLPILKKQGNSISRRPFSLQNK